MTVNYPPYSDLESQKTKEFKYFAVKDKLETLTFEKSINLLDYGSGLCEIHDTLLEFFEEKHISMDYHAYDIRYNNSIDNSLVLIDNISKTYPNATVYRESDDLADFENYFDIVISCTVSQDLSNKQDLHDWMTTLVDLSYNSVIIVARLRDDEPVSPSQVGLYLPSLSDFANLIEIISPRYYSVENIVGLENNVIITLEL